MKTFNFLSFFIFFTFLSATNLKANIIINNGQTLTLGNESIAQNIIINNGGTLVIEGDLIMGSISSKPLYILIRTGGKLISDNQGGSLSGYQEGLFEGIIVEGTSYYEGFTDYALYLDNFSISKAETPISISKFAKGFEQAINSKIYVANTDIFDSVNLLKNRSYSASYFNRDYSYNSVIFESCNFTSLGASYWPIHLNFMNLLTFSNCTFNIANDYCLHFNMLRNATVSGCEFLNDQSSLAMVFHRDNFNITIEDNIIHGSLNNFSNYAGIAIGGEYVHGNFYGGRIANNTFIDCKIGISIGDELGLLDGTDGYVENVTIFDNLFFNNYVGIQSSKSSNLLVLGNDFTANYTGLLFNGSDNFVPKVRCNEFSSSDISLKISDPTLHELSTYEIGMDDHNRFYGSGVDIVNNNGGIFNYNLYQLNYPGYPNNTTNVSIQNSTSLFDCKRWFTSPNDDFVQRDKGHAKVEQVDKNANVKKITVNPNPSIDGKFTLNLDSETKNNSITILNSLGQIIQKERTIENDTFINLDLSFFPKGIYFLNIKTGNYFHTKKIIIQ